MSQIVTHTKKVSDALEQLQQRRQQPFVQYTVGRELPPSETVKPLSSAEFASRLTQQAENDSALVPDMPEYFEGAPHDPRIPEYRPLLFGRQPARLAHNIPLLTFTPSVLSEN